MADNGHTSPDCQVQDRGARATDGDEPLHLQNPGHPGHPGGRGATSSAVTTAAGGDDHHQPQGKGAVTGPPPPTVEENRMQNQDAAAAAKGGGPAAESHGALPAPTASDTQAATAAGPGVGAGVGAGAGVGVGPGAGIGAGQQDPESYEQEHVHSVYESIATHFSATRYKPWPVIAEFLQSLAPGSVGLDVGCGNGKYLAVNPDVFIVGSDRSAALVRIARDHGGERRGEVAVADGLALPFREGAADFAICVAVIHHISTRDRRRDAVRALLQSVRPGPDGAGGKILVYVWALEQSNSRRGWDEGADQDQLVPWVMRTKAIKGEGPPAGDTTYQRYYHLFKKGELEEDVEAVGGHVLSNGYDKDNWWVIAGRKS